MTEWQRLSDQEREEVGAVLGRWIAERRTKSVDELFALFERVSRKARARGLTDEMIDAELATWNAEGRH